MLLILIYFFTFIFTKCLYTYKNRISLVIIIEIISFSDALKYPFKAPKKFSYALLLLIPILGWFIIYGYIVRLVNEFIEARYEEPIEIDLIEDLKLGAITFVKFLPFFLAYLIVIFIADYTSPILGFFVNLLLGLFVFPPLLINFFRKQTVESCFEFDILKVVYDNLGDYIVAMLKQFALRIIFGVFALLPIIFAMYLENYALAIVLIPIVLIGLLAAYITYLIFIANFYGNYIEQKNTLAFGDTSKNPSAF